MIYQSYKYNHLKDKHILYNNVRNSDEFNKYSSGWIE